MLGAALAIFARRDLWCALLPGCPGIFPAGGCQPKQSASLHVSPALESLVPSDTVIVLGVNLAAIRDTAIYQKLITSCSAAPTRPLHPAEPAWTRARIFPRSCSCSNGKSALLLVRGKFRITDLQARFKSNGVTPIDLQRARAVRRRPRRHHVSGRFHRRRRNRRRDSCAARSAQRPGRGLPVPLRDLLRTLPAGDQIYAALTGGVENLNLPLPREGNLGNVLQALRSVDSAMLGMNLTNGMDAIAVVNCNTERDAKFIHDLVRGTGGVRTPEYAR